MEALVGLLAGAEAGELAHRPQPTAVHRGVDAAGEGVLAGEADRVLGAAGAARGEVSRGVELADGLPGEGADARRTSDGAGGSVPVAIGGPNATRSGSLDCCDAHGAEPAGGVRERAGDRAGVPLQQRLLAPGTAGTGGAVVLPG